MGSQAGKSKNSCWHQGQGRVAVCTLVLLGREGTVSGLHLTPFFGPWGQEGLISSEWQFNLGGRWLVAVRIIDSFSDFHVLEYVWRVVPLLFLCEGSWRQLSIFNKTLTQSHPWGRSRRVARIQAILLLSPQSAGGSWPCLPSQTSHHRHCWDATSSTPASLLVALPKEPGWHTQTSFVYQPKI